jgi:hypothetical protein
MERKDQWIKDNLQGNDLVELPEADDYYLDLHDKIMAKVEATEIESVAPSWRRNFKDPSFYKKWMRGAMGASLMTLATLGFMQILTLQTGALQKERVVQEDTSIRSELSRTQLIAQAIYQNQSEEDMIVDMARERMDTLSQEQISEILAK